MIRVFLDYGAAVLVGYFYDGIGRYTYVAVLLQVYLVYCSGER